MSSLLTTAEINRYLSDLKAQHCKVKRNNGAGVVTAHDGEHVVLRAIQKGRGGPWITTFLDSDRITWAKPDEHAERPTA